MKRISVRLFDTDSPLAPLRPAIMERISGVVASGQFVLGPEVAAFEAELAAYLGVRHVIGVANGTDALVIALRALGVGPGDDVVLPALTFYATAEAVADVGARPVFCDVDADTRNVTVETVKAAITPKTTAIIAVDLFGVPAPIPALRARLGLPVLEDAAQAAGASLHEHRAGSLGDVATLSFYPSKNLPCFGDGGAIATDDGAIAQTARALGFHGSLDKETFTYVGYNSRLDALQAAILRVLLPELDGWCEGRRGGAQAYLDAGLAEHVGVPAVPDGAVPAWHLYAVTHPRADDLLTALAGAGVEARGYYRVPLHRQPAMAPFVNGQPALPVTDALAADNLALPISPVLGAEQAGEVVAAIARGAGGAAEPHVRVWIDFTNSPHVLVLRPVIERLQAQGHDVQVTARDFAQTLQLCDRFGIEHTEIGHHRGAGLLDKARGLLARSAQLARWARPRRFDLAIGHGSNDITVAAALLRIPCSTTFDYEWATVQHTVNCRLAQGVVVPDAIPPERLYRYGARGKLHPYPGLKEEYYLADLHPDRAVLSELGLDPAAPIAVVRTPPAVSLYHRFENDLFGEVLQRLRGTQAVVLPRTPEQRAELTRAGGFIVPERAIDAQSLIFFADLVVSAGGTMNREAVALGTPVYTVFEGRPGAVDERLIADGRLRRLHRAGEVVLVKRDPGVRERIRRDPEALVERLCAPASGRWAPT